MIDRLEARQFLDADPWPGNGVVKNHTHHTIYVLTDEFDPNDTNNSYDTDGDGVRDTGWRPLAPGQSSGTFEDVDAAYDPEVPGDDVFKVPGGTTLEFDNDFFLPTLHVGFTGFLFGTDNDLIYVPADEVDDWFGTGVDLPEYEGMGG